MEVNRLLSDELTHELEIRSLSGVGTVQEKRSILRAVCIDINEELVVCETKLNELAASIHQFDFQNKDTEYQRISSRLTHVCGRIDRLKCDNDSQLKSKSVAMSECMKLFDELEQKYLKEPSAHATPISLLDQPNTSQAPLRPTLTPTRMNTSETNQRVTIAR
ncbi:hypothetical protein FQR65_LT16768 [Abscondita terminalis]|nr:hypothetical protein FQR65_LT16768 [Abscondita terminalis]